MSTEEINRLLDAAKEVTGSHYKTAKLLGITPARVNDWRAGRQNPQPEDFALIAQIAGLDPEEALVRAVLAKHANTAKGEKLLSALGKLLPRIGAAATLLFFASVGSLVPQGTQAKTTDGRATMYIMSNETKRLIEVKPRDPSWAHDEATNRGCHHAQARSL